MITVQDFQEAVEKALTGGVAQKNRVMSEKERRTIAYHEAGHAVVMHATPHSDPVYKVTIIPRGRSLGVTQFLPEEDRLGFSESQIEGKLAVLLGGRAAERLVYDDLSTGAAEDLKQATRLARMMVTQWGMSKRVGPVFFRASEEHPFLGREMSETRDHSEHTAQVIDEEVARILREADERAFHLLEEHRDELERLAEALIEREVLTVAEIEELIGKRPGGQPEVKGDEVAASLDNPV
jgi:cell division protease FtsH